jgi:hypothetical protein
MRRLDPSDFLRVAGGGTGTPEGITRPGRDVILSSGGTRDERILVDEHERLHVELNGCNSFGVLLSMVGAGLLEVPLAQARDLLGQLVEACRTVHEVYATTISVWSRPEVDRAGSLASYPSYRTFLKQGEELAAGYSPDSMVAVALVVGACVASMQIPLDLVLDSKGQGLGDEFKDHRPNDRLRELLAAVRADSFDFSWARTEVDGRWLEGRDPDPFGSPAYKQAYHETLIRIYHQYAWWLSRRGHPVLSWDAHLRYRDPLAFVPAGKFEDQHLAPAELEALAEATARRSNSRHGVRSSERQSLRRPRYGGPVRILPLEEIAVFAHFLDAPGLHLLARPVDALVSAYALSPGQESVLRRHSLDGVITALWTVAEDGGTEPVTLLAPLRRAENLVAVLRGCVADPRIPPSIVSTTSFSCLFSRRWLEEWVVPLRLVTHATLLYDLPPSVFLEVEVGSELRFTPVSFERPGQEDSDVDPLQGIAIERAGSVGLMDRWTAFLGSEVLMSNLVARLGDLEVATPDRSVFSGPIGTAMLHLAEEEPEFHFRGPGPCASASIREPAANPARFALWVQLARRFAAHQVTWKRTADQLAASEEGSGDPTEDAN